jgi:hypothetical protein
VIFTGAVPHRHSASASAFGKAATLKREGFQEGVLEAFGTKADGTAVSAAAVLRSARGAKQLLKAESAKELEEAGESARFAVPAIPGSFGARESEQQPSGHGQTFGTGVLFSTGRCFVEILTLFDSTRDTSMPERVERAAIAGAIKLYRRVKHVCA